MTIDLDHFVDVDLALGSVGVIRTDFSATLLLGFHAFTTHLIKRYGDYDEMVADGFTANHPLSLAAKRFFRQRYRAEYLYIGRRQTAPVHRTDNTVATVTGKTISMTLRYLGTEATYTRVGTGVPGADAAQLAIDINAGIFNNGGAAPHYITATAVGADVQIRPGAGAVTGQIFYYDNLAYITPKDITADPGLAADITAIRAEPDGDLWYWFCPVDATSETQIDAIDGVIDGLEKLAVYQVQDGEVPVSGSGDIASVLILATSGRNKIVWSRYALDEMPAPCVIGDLCPLPVGSWAAEYHSMVGWTADSVMTSSELAQLEAKRVLGNLRSGGKNFAWESRLPNDTWLDERVIADKFRQECRNKLVDYLIRASISGKPPYLNSTQETALAELKQAHDEMVPDGAFTQDGFLGSYTKVEDQTTADRDNRKLNGLKVTAVFQGATRMFGVRVNLV